MKPSKDISRLIEIMVALRDPESGCPWDIEQSFASIAPYTIEEAYEVLDAIERNDMQDLRDELGDLLLQVIFHSRIAEERNSFSFGDVVEAITTKMIRRHPHVFGDVKAREAGMAKGMWDKIKAEEKSERQAMRGDTDASKSNGFLDDIPDAFPALTKALKLQQKAALTGFDWGEALPILDKIEEEISELKHEIIQNDQQKTAEEFGDLLFAMVNLGRHLGLDPESALRSTNNKFKRRFKHIEESLKAINKELSDSNLDEMETYWQLAKEKE